MHTRKIKLNKRGHPKTVTVEMTIDEAGAIAKTFGGMSPIAFCEKFPNLADSDVLEEVYGCLVGEVFNRYWDDGVNGWNRGTKPDHGGL